MLSRGIIRFGFELFRYRFLRGIESGAPTQGINGLKPSCRDEPGARIGRQPVLRPTLQSCGKGVMQRVLGKIEIAQEANKRGQNSAGLRAVNRIHELMYLFSDV